MIDVLGNRQVSFKRDLQGVNCLFIKTYSDVLHVRFGERFNATLRCILYNYIDEMAADRGTDRYGEMSVLTNLKFR